MKLAFPVMIAPCGPARIVHPDGDCALARAAHSLGTAHVVPHMGGHRLEDVRRASPGPLLYQIYNVGGREVAEAAIRRAAATGYQALVVTIDNSGARRERDERNELGRLMSGKLSRSWPLVPRLFMHPRWLYGFLQDGRPVSSPNAQLADGTPMQPSQIMASMATGKSTFDWSDFGWLREAWQGPILVKGVLSAADANRAISEGATGIIISNHGGRSLDSMPPTTEVLPEIAAAVAGRAEVILDSGIRRGADVVKALAMGADAVLVGRLTLYGLAQGEAGSVAALAMLRDDIRKTMSALGCPDIRSLRENFVRVQEA